MNENLTVVKLYDETIIWAKKSKKGRGVLRIWNYKQVREGEIPQYVEDEMAISKDAIRVFFRVIHGGKTSEGVQGTLRKPDPTPAA